LPNKVEPVYTSFKDRVTAVDDAYKLSRASDYTQKIADEDDRRDNLYRQLVNLLKMYSRFGYDTENNGSSTGSETAGNGGSSEGSESGSGSGSDDTDQ
jgi:hypothetical protein